MSVGASVLFLSRKSYFELLLTALTPQITSTLIGPNAVPSSSMLLSSSHSVCKNISCFSSSLHRSAMLLNFCFNFFSSLLKIKYIVCYRVSCFASRPSIFQLALISLSCWNLFVWSSRFPERFNSLVTSRLQSDTWVVGTLGHCIQKALWHSIWGRPAPVRVLVSFASGAVLCTAPGCLRQDLSPPPPSCISSFYYKLKIHTYKL